MVKSVLLSEFVIALLRLLCRLIDLLILDTSHIALHSIESKAAN